MSANNTYGRVYSGKLSSNRVAWLLREATFRAINQCERLSCLM